MTNLKKIDWTAKNNTKLLNSLYLYHLFCLNNFYSYRNMSFNDILLFK